MLTFLFLTLFLSPILNAERLQTGLETNDDLLMRRSVAASYLFGSPIRRYQPRFFDPSSSSSLPSSSDSDDQSQPRAKRIYWENLAFHAADYNQKPKKV